MILAGDIGGTNTRLADFEKGTTVPPWWWKKASRVKTMKVLKTSSEHSSPDRA